jgi:hypothetical protein
MGAVATGCGLEESGGRVDWNCGMRSPPVDCAVRLGWHVRIIVGFGLDATEFRIF